MILSIITATYNRGYCLHQIYDSLLSNSKDDFEWIIVDDGSDDGTEEIVKAWIHEGRINLVYVYQENGGKTSAIINGFRNKPRGKFSVVLDSDDFLVESFISKYKDCLVQLPNEFIGIIGLKSEMDGRVIGERFNVQSSDYINLYFGRNAITGDKLFVIRTELYEHAFIPPFPGEKFVPDNIPYIKVNSIGSFRLINDVFYRGEYLKDGMTANVNKLAAKNISGFILEKQLLQHERLFISYKVLNYIKFIFYSRVRGDSFIKILRSSKSKLFVSLLFIPTIIFTYSRMRAIKHLI